MSIGKYKINRFFGIDQSVEENYLANGYTADACNMNTDDGNLSVAKGFTRKLVNALPGDEDIHRCVVFRHKNGDIHIAIAGDTIYLNMGTGWIARYTYPSPLENHDFGFAEVKIDDTDYLLIANGETQMLKFNSTAVREFGSEEMCSNRPVRYLAMYKNRLFAAGDSEFPNRLYWSKLPGDGRTIEDWSAGDSSVNVEGGHTQIGMFDSDPIVAITALSSQLLIFKKNSLYRLYGDKPSNFTVEEIESVIEYTPHTSIVHYGDVAYFMTKNGMYIFDGVSAHPMQDAERIKNILAECDTACAKGARTRDKIFYLLKRGNEDVIIEYSLKRQTYMLRQGFNADDIFSRNGDIYIVSDRWVCKFDDGDTYAGNPIHAYWKTPLTDLDEKTVIKQLLELCLRGDRQKRGVLHLETEAGGIKREYSIRLDGSEAVDVPLCDEGRSFCLKFSNEAGGTFSIRGGLELLLSMRGRCI